MGTDITIVKQKKHPKLPDVWYGDFEDMYGAVGRNYPLFAYIAKVRGEFPESLEPKGIPPNIDYKVREYFDTEYACSYFSARELELIMTEFLLQDLGELHNSIQIGLSAMLSLFTKEERENDSAILVFGFDC